MPPARAAAAPIPALARPFAITPPAMKPRLLPIVITVACAHGLALWALQSGLLRTSPVVMAPVVMVAQLIELAQPAPAPAPAPAPSRPKAETPTQRAVQARPKTPHAPSELPTSSPVKAPESAVAPTAAPAPPSDARPSPSNESASAQVVQSSAPAQPSAPAPAKIELPSSSARYLNNPPPPYPAISKRMGEQGRVVVRAFIDVNGSASQASITSSSGYERLDQVALKTVLQWRYVPGKRAGIPESMWFNVPLNFVLE